MNTRDHERHADDAAAYLLGALNDLERQAFEAHLAVCAECREQTDALRPAAGALPRSVTPLAAPPGLKRSLMEVVHGEAAERAPQSERRSLRERLADALPAFGARPALAWAGAAFLLAVGVAGGVGIGELASGGNEGARTLSASIDHTRAPSASASLVVPGSGHNGAILRVHGMPQAGPRRVYQVWLQRGREVIPGPTFVPRKDGSGAAAVPDAVDHADAVMVTRERLGGAASPSEQPILSVKT
jgi:anti-sigma factor RsiW